MTGHTPQKLPAFAAISCIIAVRAQYPYARSSIIPSFSPFVKDNFRIFYKISIEFLSISQNFLFAHSPPVPPYFLFPLPSSLFPKIPSLHTASKGSLGKVVLWVSRRYRAGRRAAAVNACTVQLFSLPNLLGNVTGRVREVTSTDQLGAKSAAGTARRAPGFYAFSMA